MAGLIMPSPTKVVRQSVSVCRRAGMTREQALATVVKVCDAVVISISDESISLQSWVVDVRLVAVTALGNPPADTLESWRG